LHPFSGEGELSKESGDCGGDQFCFHL
jgi:hypothetical protein